MVLVKILGAVDLAAAGALLIVIFDIPVFVPYFMFCAGLLFLKGLFALTGDILSFIDLVASFTILLSIFFTPFSFLLWTLTFLLIAKGFVSFL